ncbi:MAG: hypothetical protein HC924_14460, partial [Synechococcaceae cyanobacterium SM2_3_2]|nr:hypothetical protein [Synechococcaceae cyanobacterium SM2_3_2]
MTDPPRILKVYRILETYYWGQEKLYAALGRFWLELTLWSRIQDPRCLGWSQHYLEQALVASCCCTQISLARANADTDQVPFLSTVRQSPSRLGISSLGSLGLHLLLVLAMIWWGSRPIEIEEPPQEEEPLIEIAYIELSPPPPPPLPEPPPPPDPPPPPPPPPE